MSQRRRRLRKPRPRTLAIPGEWHFEEKEVRDPGAGFEEVAEFEHLYRRAQAGTVK